MSASDVPINPDDLVPVLKTLVQKAKSYGADDADAIATHGRSLSITVRETELEDVDNSEGRDVGLRVIVGQQQACVSSSDISPASLDMLAERAVAMARLAPEDPYCGLAPPDIQETSPQSLDLFDAGVMSPELLKQRALELEAATLSVKGVTQAEGASAAWSTSAIHFLSSGGFSAGWRSSRHSLSGMAIAARGDDMERDADYHGTRWLSDLREARDIGRRAGERAVARLGSEQMTSGTLPVIFDRRVTGSFVAAFLGAISGSAITRGVSFLKDSLGKQIFAPHVNIIDDPHRPRGHGSRPWDGEGVRTQSQNLIENGTLTTWLHNTSTAKQLGHVTTGHASRGIGSPPGVTATNSYMAAGSDTPEALMTEIGEGLFVTEMFGPSINHNTGDYSVGVAGFKIEAGEKTSPVSEITVAGNLKDMFANMRPANDLEFTRATVAPTILVESLTLAGL